MVLILILALVSIGLALALAARAAALPRIRAEESLGQIEAYGYHGQPTLAPEAIALLPKLAARVGALGRGQAADQRQEETRKLLLSAGIWDVSAPTFVGYRVLAAFGGAVVLGWLASGGGSMVLGLAAAAYAGAFCWYAPVGLLKSRARRRAERIEIELPELIDLLVVTLEAGLGFNAALKRSAERVRGPLGDEINLALREHNLGLTMEEALQNFLDRCNAPAVRSFVRAVTQGEALGISIGQIMRELAGDLRTRRRQIIEEKAQKAPIKILFPLAFLILPSIFVVVLFPGLYEIMQTLGA